LQKPVCVCALLPSLPTRTRIILLLHQLEARKTTNTGHLAVRCLPNSSIAWRGNIDETTHGESSDQSTAPAWLAEATRPVLLFPAEDARPLGSFVGAEEPVTLIVPDGTWSQASRARKRVPGLAALPCAKLPDELVSTYRLRHDPRPGRLSTMQAIAHALEILEGSAIAQELLRVHQIAVERTLYTKGRLSAAEVTGGLPRFSSD
jgi:DTW domain-containing protein YfiP